MNPCIDPSFVRSVLVSPEGRRAIASGDAGAVIKAVRRSLDWSQEELGRVTGHSQSFISRLEGGRTRVDRDIDTMSHFASILKIPRPALGLSAVTDEENGMEGVGVRRREFLAGALSASAVLLPASIVDARSIGQADVQDAWRALQRLRELDHAVGGFNYYPVVADMAKRVQAALNRASYTATVESDLHHLAAATMLLAGWFAFDSGRPEDSWRWWLEASHLAEVGNNPSARTSTLAVMSLQACKDIGKAKDTLGLTRLARSVAGSSASPILLSILAARDAVAHAHLLDAPATRKSMAESRKYLDHGRDGSEPEDLAFWGPADLSAHERDAALAMREGRAAERFAGIAVEMVDPAVFPRNHVNYLASQSQVLARTGKLDDAVAKATDVVSGLDSVSGSRRIVRKLDTTLKIFEKSASKPVREFAGATRLVLPA